MSDDWGRLIARLVEEDGGNQSRTARRIGVSSQRVGGWLKGAGVDVKHLRMVARVTNHSLPYLMAVAYGIPMEEMADGVGSDVLAHDPRITNRRALKHLVDQYAFLEQIAPDKGADEAESS
jgi:transcriptional regulator with XRE-family HTH domain